MNWLASLLYYRDHSIVAILTQIGVMAEIDNADLASALSDILENLSSNLNCILIVYFRASVCNRRLHYKFIYFGFLHQRAQKAENRLSAKAKVLAVFKRTKTYLLHRFRKQFLFQNTYKYLLVQKLK